MSKKATAAIATIIALVVISIMGAPAPVILGVTFAGVAIVSLIGNEK